MTPLQTNVKDMLSWQTPEEARQNLLACVCLSKFRGAHYGTAEIDGRVVKTINIPIEMNALMEYNSHCWVNMLAVKINEQNCRAKNPFTHMLMPIYPSGFYKELISLGYKVPSLGKLKRPNQNRIISKKMMRETQNQLKTYHA